jgi:hypothetical protein
MRARTRRIAGWVAAACWFTAAAFLIAGIIRDSWLSPIMIMLFSLTQAAGAVLTIITVTDYIISPRRAAREIGVRAAMRSVRDEPAHGAHAKDDTDARGYDARIYDFEARQ